MVVYSPSRMDNKLRIKWLLSALALLLIIWGGSVLLSRSGAKQPSGQQAPSENAPAAAMEGMRATEFRQGVKRWDLTAKRAEYDKQSELTVLSGVSLTVAGKKSFGPVTLVAAQAEFLNVSKNLRLPAGVTGSGDRRLRFSAGQAVFSNASSLLTARDHVRYEDELLRVEGEEMEFNADTRELRLKRQVRATIYPQAVDR